MVVRRKSSGSSPPKSADKQVTTPKIDVHVATATASSSTGGIGRTVLSIADAWVSSQRVTEFLEGLKNRVADREGISFVPLDAFHRFIIAISYSPGCTTDSHPGSLVRGEIRLIYHRHGFS
jgi:hypothetical protein